MITERYVPFDLAKLLKEKGFDVPCYNAYWIHLDYDCQYNWSRHPKNWNCDVGNHCSRPTYQMVVEWLESKDIIIVITPYYRRGFAVYMFDIIMKDENGDWTSKSKGDYDGSEYSTRWETLDAAIEWILANLL